MQKRVFLGIKANDEIREKIIEVQNKIKKVDANVKFVEPENLHFTVKFYGDKEEKEIEDIKSLMQNIGFKTFEANVKGIGVFPSMNRINVIWIGLEDDKMFMDLIDEIYAKLNLKKDKRLSAHLTIARVKSTKNKELLKQKIAELKDFTAGRMNIEKITLFESTLTAKGPVYSVLFEKELKK